MGLGLALFALVAFVWLANPSGEDSSVPAPLEAVRPIPGDAVLPQTAIEIDLPVGYEIDLVIDGVPVPRSEITSISAVGTFRWEPAPGRIVETWTPGTHTVEVSWDRVTGRPDPGAYAWTFRVT